MTKISLGTAQWGLNYGIANSTGIPSLSDINDLISYARVNKICMLDTANTYGEVESKLGKIGIDDFDTITKVSVSKGQSAKIENLVKTSSLNMKLNSIYGCLVHNPQELLKDSKIWEALKKEKERGIISKIGYSVYEPEVLNRLLDKNMFPDIVQLPYSILDRKFERAINFLKHEKVEIHVRSVFLQGVYFLELNKLPVTLQPLKKPLKKINSICKVNSLSMLELCLSFVSKNNNIDFVVMGVENLGQLVQINDFFQKSNKLKLVDDSTLDFSFDQKLLNPTNW